LKITPNLNCALMNLRLDSQPRVLWIDAICINQTDLVERSTQVNLMLQIYQKAKKTVVYLGEKSADSDVAAEYLESHMTRVRAAIADFMNRRRFANSPAEMLQICAKTLGTSQAKLFEGSNQTVVQKALVSFLCRPWFRRIWVIQEFVVSANVDMYCGKTKCEWGSFGMMFQGSFAEAKVTWDQAIEPEQRLDFYRGTAQIMQMHELRNKFHGADNNTRKSRLLQLLTSCRQADATMPVDKVFALLNLSSERDPPQPDYLRSKAEIYQQCAEYEITKNRNTSILYEAVLTNRLDATLPSWVPDWSEMPLRISLGQTLNKTNKWFFNAGRNLSGSWSRMLANPSSSTSFFSFDFCNFCTSATSSDSESPSDHTNNPEREALKPSLRIEGNILFVTGVCVQIIAAIGSDFPVPGINADEAPNLHRLTIILSYVHRFVTAASSYPTGEDRSIVAGALLQADQHQHWSGVTSFWEDTQSRDLSFEPELELPSFSEVDDIIEAMKKRRHEDPTGYANMYRAVAGRRFAYTIDGYAALVPEEAKLSDEICILKGFAVPFVLRQVGEHFCLVGDAYVHGLMMGEAFVLNENLEDLMVEIPIC
jgi:hypothetical protein